MSDFPHRTSLGEIPSESEMVKRAAELIPRIRERGLESDRMRHIPQETIDEARAAGLLKMMAPPLWGGYGMGLAAYLNVCQALARGCVSTAWTVGFLIEHCWMLARYPLEVQQMVFADDPAPQAAGPAGGPACRFTEVERGYQLSGHWSFASAIMHSDWCMLSAPAADGRRLKTVVPIGDITVKEVWDTAGLRGTGSHDVVAEDLFVPAERVMEDADWLSPDNPGSRVHDLPLYRYPVLPVAMLMTPTFALGAAEGAAEVFKEVVAQRKVGGKLQIESHHTWGRYADVFRLITTARLLRDEALNVVLSALGPDARGTLTDEHRARYRLCGAGSVMASSEAVNQLCEAAGANQQRMSAPLQRYQRDVNVLVTHSTARFQEVGEIGGRVLLGQAGDLGGIFF